MDKAKGPKDELQKESVTEGMYVICKGVLAGSEDLPALQAGLSRLDKAASLEKKLGCSFTKAVVLAWDLHQFSIISLAYNFQPVYSVKIKTLHTIHIFFCNAGSK